MNHAILVAVSFAIGILVRDVAQDWRDKAQCDAEAMRVQLASRSEHVTMPAGQVRVNSGEEIATGESLQPGGKPVPAGSLNTAADSTQPPEAASPALERRQLAVFPLTHPLSCAGTWIKKCADWEAHQPCETICLEGR